MTTGRGRRSLRRQGLLGLLTLVCCFGTMGAASATGEAGATSAGPVLTVYSSGAHVTGDIAVTVSTSVPEVLVAWESTTDLEYPVSVDNGEATVTLSTSGYHGPTTIVARECSDTGVCDGAQTSMTVDVANPAPVIDGNSWLDEVHGDFAVWLDEPEPAGWYGYFVDGIFVPPVVQYQGFGFSADYLGDGKHTVQVARCVEAPDQMPIVETPVCDMQNASEVRTVTVRTALHPSITAVRPRTISPDGNQIADRAAVTVTVDSPQILGWHLERAGEPVGFGSWTRPEPGPYTFTVDGLDDEGRPLPSGTYTLAVVARSAPVPEGDNRMITGETSTQLVIDRSAPRVTDASASPSVFYPIRDGFRDRVRIAGTLSEPASRLRVELLRDGRVRRTLRLGGESDGRFATTWSGRRPKGRLAQPGRYRYRFVATDRAGNQAIRRGGTVTLRWRR